MFPQRFTRVLLCLVLSATFLPFALSMLPPGDDAEATGGFVEVSVSGGTVVPIVVAASFSRITDDQNKLIINDRAPSTREHVFNVIENNPGIHFRDICRQLNKEIGVVQYHVYILKRFGMITSMRDGRFTRYFTKEAGLDDVEKAIVAAWQRPVERQVLVDLLDAGEQVVRVDQIASTCEVTTQAVTWHLNRLQASGLIRGWTAELEPLDADVRGLMERLLERGIISA